MKVGRSRFLNTKAGKMAAQKLSKLTNQKMVPDTEYMTSPQAQFAGLTPKMPMQPSTAMKQKKRMFGEDVNEPNDSPQEDRAEKMKSKKKKRK